MTSYLTRDVQLALHQCPVFFCSSVSSVGNLAKLMFSVIHMINLRPDLGLNRPSFHFFSNILLIHVNPTLIER